MSSLSQSRSVPEMSVLIPMLPSRISWIDPLIALRSTENSEDAFDVFAVLRVELALPAFAVDGDAPLDFKLSRLTFFFIPRPSVMSRLSTDVTEPLGDLLVFGERIFSFDERIVLLLGDLLRPDFC